MISHTDCAHEKSSKARAQCRRERAKSSGGEEAGATVREVDFSGAAGASVKGVDFSGVGSRGEKERHGVGNALTPGHKHMECQVCGLERVKYKGTDQFSGLTVAVGDKCEYRIRTAPDRMELRS